jgi:secreted PhoX family phosphatase
VFAVPVKGASRGLLRQFLSGVPGGEVCGPEFSGDNRTFFCAIQHPNDGNAFNEVWPINDPDGVSKPALIAVTHDGGAKIGS